MKSPKRTKGVKIRLTDQEHQILLDKKNRGRACNLD
ncbi:hypothetical protein E9S_01419 [Moraxella catarrhalis BC7]|nr:hypothetical protein E9S_01419 [Moraxella catarrhalis BC7]